MAMTHALTPRSLPIAPGDILRHGLQVLVFCCLVAVFTSMLWPGTGYGPQLVHSVAIGMLIWIVIEFGRLLVPEQHRLRDPTCRGPGWPRGWRGVLLTAVGIAVGYFGGSALARLLLGEASTYPVRDQAIGLVVTIVAGIAASFYFFTRGRQAAMQAAIAEAERDASDTRLALLQSQLEPHMLFNTLANLRALIAADPAAAQHMVDRLEAYLRATLGASRATEHSLAEEFARLDDYLQLMAIRMGARLHYRLELPEALRALPVPTLLLQPLVENAVRHGLEPCVAGGRVEVAATCSGDMLLLTVRDSGVGFDTMAAEARPGRFGLVQVRERVATAYGEHGKLQLQSALGAGTMVRVTLPLHALATRT